MVLKAPFMGQFGGVSSEHPLASIAGYKVLREGGNAVDASVAVSLALAVTQPHLGSLGGDFFALIFESSTGRVHCINSSGWSPERLNIQVLEEAGLNGIPVSSPHAVVVPGLISGLQQIYERFGTVKFSRLVEDAIVLADKGFPVSYGLSESVEHSRGKLADPFAKDLFFKNDRPLMVGEIFVQRSLAKVLRSLISDPRIFYEGWIAESLCKFLNSKGGVFSLDDFKDFEGEWVEPLKVTYRDYELYEVPPNSQGATSLIIMNILENFDLKDLDPLGAERIHLFVEAAKRAYMDKNQFLADPRFVDVPLEKILSKSHGKELAETIKKESVMLDVSLKPGDTTNFVVIDRWGNIVSAIQSIFHGFGSGLIDPETGILLNSRASYFNLSGPNSLEPRKRPLHTLSSVIAISEDEEYLALGASGGDFRPQQHALLLTNLIDYSMDLQSAVETPRFLWNGYAEIIMEEGLRGLDSLKKIGHKPVFRKYPARVTGVAHCGFKKSKVTMLSADMRGDGLPAGLIG